jgi:hypothetical protein
MGPELVEELGKIVTCEFPLEGLSHGFVVGLKREQALRIANFTRASLSVGGPIGRVKRRFAVATGCSAHLVYLDPPDGIKYDSNFQQRVDSTKNDEKDAADDVLTIKAFRDTWALGIHSYLSYLQERLYLCRELLAESGSIFLQMGDENAHITRALLDEVFGAVNFVSEVIFYKTSGKGGAGLDAVFDRLLWYAKDKPVTSRG